MGELVAKWQAAQWPGPNVTRGGKVAQMSWAFGQRVRKTQPLGGLTGLGRLPLTPSHMVLRAGSGAGMARISA